ncbi:MAG: Nramp family divalent metal transporter [Planctomycetota bacterium]
MPKTGAGLLALIGPGVLVAATGVGAGDLATAGFAGQRLGVAVAWAVVVGALVKLVLNESLARWQLATGETIIEGIVRRLGPVAWACLMLYLLFWTWFVGAALMSACGAVISAMTPGPDSTVLQSPVFYGIGCSALGVALVLAGGFKFFERLMALCIGFMFVAVILAAVIRLDDPLALLGGLAIPRVPEAGGDGLDWTVALAGGVGGTLTIVCYSYWMRESGRTEVEDLKRCRTDIIVAYSMTAVFGVAMLVIASGLNADGRGSVLIAGLAESLGDEIGAWARWVFLVGALGAVFSSLLGVWQSVPYVFADLVRLRPPTKVIREPVSTRSLTYRIYLFWIAFTPIGGLFVTFGAIQKWYAIVGAFFIPVLGLCLVLLNNRRELGTLRNGWMANAVLIASVGALLWAAIYLVAW